MTSVDLNKEEAELDWPQHIGSRPQVALIDLNIFEADLKWPQGRQLSTIYPTVSKTCLDILYFVIKGISPGIL